MKTSKLFSLLVVSIVLTGSLAFPAGVFASNFAKAVDFTYVDLDNSNRGFVGNWQTAKSNTGFNFGGEDAVIGTGSAEAGTQTSSSLNSNSTEGTLTDSQSGPTAVNYSEGDYLLNGSDSVAIAVDIKYIGVHNFNGGVVINDSLARANTGFNRAGEDSEIDTGSASAQTTTSTVMNSNETTVTVEDTGMIGPVAANVDFNYFADGADAMPAQLEGDVAVAIEADIVLVENRNFGFVHNDSVAMSNTGGNFTGEDSELETSAAQASTSTDSTVNLNQTSVTLTDSGIVGPMAINADGDFTYGDIEDSCIGGDFALAVDKNAAIVLNDNSAFVINDSKAMANSGLNKTGEDSELTTGGATASTATTNNVNSNSTNVVIADSSMGPVAANVDMDTETLGGAGISCITCGGSMGPVAANVNTDGGTAIAVDTNVAMVSNDNRAMVINDSEASANTGMNRTGGDSTVVTGDASAATSTSNDVNSNSTNVEINDTTGVGPTAANVETSGDSTAVSTETVVVSADNNNSGAVVNGSQASANTGGNTGGCNADGSSITTGNANSTTTTTNTVNSNTTTFVINQ